MAFYHKKKYKLPNDVCDYINKMCMFQLEVETNKKILHMELISHFQDDVRYSMHEFYFVQLLTFLHKLKPIIPKYNSELDIYDISLREELINIYHHTLYKDHINIFLYQNKQYSLFYYNYLEIY